MCRWSGSGAGSVRDPQEFRQSEYLSLVVVGNRFEVGGTVAVFDEKPLVVLQPIGRPRHGEIQPIGVIVLGHLADPLLVVGGGDELQIDRSGHSRGLLRFHGSRTVNWEIFRRSLSRIEGRGHLTLPAFAVVGETLRIASAWRT